LPIRKVLQYTQPSPQGEGSPLDTELKETVDSLEAGQADAELGGNVYKMRIARPGEGKSGGYRVIVFFRSGDKTFFVYGFAKSEKGNIDRGELQGFKVRSKDAFSMTEEQINYRLKNGTLVEVF